MKTTASTCTRAIDRFSRLLQKPTCVLANQNSTSQLRQSECHVAATPIRTRELSSRLSGQRRILTHFGAHLTQHHAQGCTNSITSICPHYLSLASMPFSLWVRQRATLGSYPDCGMLTRSTIMLNQLATYARIFSNHLIVIKWA